MTSCKQCKHQHFRPASQLQEPNEDYFPRLFVWQWATLSHSSCQTECCTVHPRSAYQYLSIRRSRNKLFVPTIPGEDGNQPPADPAAWAGMRTQWTVFRTEYSLLPQLLVLVFARWAVYKTGAACVLWETATALESSSKQQGAGGRRFHILMEVHVILSCPWRSSELIGIADALCVGLLLISVKPRKSSASFHSQGSSGELCGFQYSINRRNTPTLQQPQGASFLVSTVPGGWEQGWTTGTGVHHTRCGKQLPSCRASDIPISNNSTQFCLFYLVLRCCPCVPRQAGMDFSSPRVRQPGQRGWGAWAILNTVSWVHRLAVGTTTPGSLTLERQPEHSGAFTATYQAVAQLFQMQGEGVEQRTQSKCGARSSRSAWVSCVVAAQSRCSF